MQLIEDILSMKPVENFDNYRLRCFTLKARDNICSYKQLNEIMNKYLPVDMQRSVSAITRECNKLKSRGILDYNQYNVISPEDSDCKDDDEIDLFAKVKMMKCQISDERIQANAYYRRMSREDTIKEIASDYAEIMNKEKVLDTYTYKEPLNVFGNAGLLCISDWHYGLECNNHFNVYNPKVFKERLAILQKRVVDICIEQRVNTLYIMNLGDLISGRIHLTLRLESRLDVITQTMDIAEILAEFLTNLSKYFNIEYFDCVDNHSRLEPNKKESLELETLVRIIPWFLKSRLTGNDSIHINSNDFSDDLIKTSINGFNVAGVHGHKDSQQKIIDNLTHMIKEPLDLIVSAHFHHFSADENSMCLRISNGSLMGTDTHAMDLRLTSKPSQNLIIVSKDNVMEALYRITLD